MSKGSQLSQLKSALNQAGLSRQPPSGKKRKHSGSREYDKDKKAKKLQEIHAKLNPFDVKVTKPKHDVPGRKIKGATGHPQESKQAGIEQRKKTLLKEYETKGRVGGIVDRRFGENDPTMAPEEKMLERFTKERQRASKGALFNLEDEDELTHYGQSLSMLDDFDATGLDVDRDSDEDGKIDRKTVARAHFGGFGEEESDDEEDGPPRKKTKAEVMQEVIAKSKQHKFERQAQRQEASEIRHQLDQELDDIRGLLFANPVDEASSSVAKETKHEDQDYDQHVRELALDKRAQPKDRTKTEEELAIEAKEALEKAERKRQKRMRGESDSESEGDGPSRRKGRRKVGGDDLDDDFADDDNGWNGLGTGLGGSDVEEDEYGVGEQVAGDADDDEDEEQDDDEDSEEDDDEEGEEDDDDESTDADTEGDSVELAPRSAGSFVKEKSKGELPFTFPCPLTLDEFLETVETIDAKDVPTVIQRIRTLYHPSLDKDNKFKLQTFLGVMVDYILHITSLPAPSFALLPSLLPHLRSLVTSYPITSAEHFLEKLKLMQKNLTRGLSKGPTLTSSKTWPGPSELAFFWVISHVWPTSDMNHIVVSPARLLMGSYLGLCRIRSVKDICSGLFLCSLFLQYEEHSKRFVPEIVPFLINSLLHLGVHKFKSPDSLPGFFSCPDAGSDSIHKTKARGKAMKGLKPQKPDLVAILCEGEGEPISQSRLDLLVLTIELIGRFADLYKALDAFTELFEPVTIVLEGLAVDWASEDFQQTHTKALEAVKRLVKFAKQSKRPLTLQAHKPIPIATYIPKFASSSSSYLRQKDPDDERAAASKLRYQYKQERKGAIRELRKDARFLSSVQHQKQQEKDKAYADKMNKVASSLQSERAEQKQLEREKAREKRRAGKK